MGSRQTVRRFLFYDKHFQRENRIPSKQQSVFNYSYQLRLIDKIPFHMWKGIFFVLGSSINVPVKHITVKG
jgi:hypothetical protein